MNAIAIYQREIAQQTEQLRSISEHVSTLGSVDDVKEIRARAEAIKAWAKVHKQTKHLRLDLLRIEVEALVRIAELGGLDTLSPSEQEAATTLLSMAPDEREQMMAEYGQVTTAAGLVRAMIRREEGEAAYRHEVAEWANRFSAGPRRIDGEELDPTIIKHYASLNRYALASIVNRYTESDAPFTVDEVAEDVLITCGGGYPFEANPVVLEGLKEVARKAIRSTPGSDWEGTIIPATITVLVETEKPGEQFLRIPIGNARLSDVTNNVEIRREQLRQDEAALLKLERFLEKLSAIPGANPDSNVADLIEGK